MSPLCTSPPTVPVTATVPPASAALTMLSAVMASTVMPAVTGGVDRVELVVRRRGDVAGRVGGGDAGVDGDVGIGREVAAGDVDAEGTAGDGAGIGRAVDRQGDGVAVLDVAADRAGHRDRAAGLRCIDDVVGGDGVRRSGSPSPWCRQCRAWSSVAVTVLPAASVVVTLASTVWSASAARSLPATSMLKVAAGDRAGIGGAVDRQGDGVAVLDVAADRAGHRDRAAGFSCIDDVVGGDGVDARGSPSPWCRPCRSGRRSRCRRCPPRRSC